MSEKRLGEFALIARYFAPLAANAPGAAGLSDDAATLRLAHGDELVVTTDALVEGVHFFKTDPPDLIARKSLRVNLSDVAAKGAVAQSYLLALSLPNWVEEDWIARFASGLAQDQNQFSVSLLGGDTTATPGPLTLAITAFGTMKAGQILRRSAARIGDAIFVTGTIGDAGGGLAILKGEGAVLPASQREALIARYRLPEPRAAIGPSLVGLAHASLDVSDGLLADLGHIAETSGVKLVIDAGRVPISPTLRTLWGEDALRKAAGAGDDYEIAFTAPASARQALAHLSRQSGVAITEIGQVEAGKGVILADSAGQPVPVVRAGYTHF